MTPVQSGTAPTVTIVMPALDEESNIRSAMRNTLAAFDDFHLAGELIVVDDGSTDGTGRAVAEELDRDPRVRTIRHEQPRGVGASFWDGVARARGEFVCMLPGDNENDPWEILRYVSVLDHVDIVIPFVFNKQARSALRNLLSLAYQSIINVTFRANFNYTNGTIMYRRKVLETVEVQSDGFFFQTDILIRLVKRGYLFAEVPYRLNVRKHGESRAVSWRSLWRVMRGYLRLFGDIYFGSDRRRPRPLASESQTAKRLAGTQAVVAQPRASEETVNLGAPLR